MKPLSAVWTMIILACSGPAAVWADDPGLASAHRKDGLTEISGHAMPNGSVERQRLLSALRAARAGSDADAVQALHRQLGWISRPPNSSQSGDDLCRRVVCHDHRNPPRRWEADVLVSDPAASCGYPTMTTEESGRLWMAVDDLSGNYIHVYFTDNDGVTWVYYFSLDCGTVSATNPSIAIGEGLTKHLLIAYEYAAATSDAAIHVYTEDLATHESSTAVLEAGSTVRHPQICVDSPEANYWYPYVTYVRGVISDDRNYSVVLFTRSYDYGVTWQAPTPLATQTTYDNRPDIDYGGSHLYAVYTRTYGPGDRDTYVRRSPNYGSTWDAEVALGYSTDDECYPRVAATNGGDAVVVAYSRWWSPSNADIDDYYSDNAGDTWHFGSFPAVPGGVSGGVDLCASLAFGSIHAGFVNGGHVYYTGVHYSHLTDWSDVEVVNDTGTAEGDEWVAVAANPRRQVDECVAWADHRAGSSEWVFFDSGYPLGDYIIIDGPGNLAYDLAPLMLWKESLGYAIKYVTVSQILAAYPDGDRGERIWSYLSDRRVATRHVLLVGEIAQIPMRILYPDGDPGHGNGYGSDYYYSKLNTADWDVDNDNRWGEFEQDQLDFYPDVIVGRIPFDDGSTVAAIAQNTVAFEQDTGAWKRNILLAHGIFNNTEEKRTKTDCAWSSEWIEQDFLEPHGWSVATLYERVGQDSSLFPPTSPLNQTNFEFFAGLQQQSIINCSAHGSTTGMTSYQWVDDINGNGYVDVTVEYDSNDFALRWQIPQDPVSALVFLAGCNTGIVFGSESTFATSPLRSGYLFTIQHDATALLAFMENGAPAVIGSSAGSDYEAGWMHPDHGDEQSLNYYFYRFLLDERLRAGDAFAAAMLYYVQRHDHQRGIRVFNYFGDPSLEIAGVTSRRWRSNNLAGSVLPAEGPFRVPQEEAGSTDGCRDEDPTIWWQSGGIEHAKSVEAIVQASGSALFAAANLHPGDAVWQGTVQQSLDGGATWSPTGGLADCRTVTSLLETGFGSLLAGGLAHTGDQWQGAIYRSTNGGTSWSRVFTLPGGMVLDLLHALDGSLWAATGWNGAIYSSSDDGQSWNLSGSIGTDVYVYGIAQSPTGRLFATVGGPAGAEGVFWSDSGGNWFPAYGLEGVTAAYDLIECEGLLYLGTATSSGAAVFASDLNGELWGPTPPIPDARLLAVRSLCVGPEGLILAGCEMERGPSGTDVLAWAPGISGWYSFGGVIDMARRVHALCPTPGMLFAGTGDEYGHLCQHILPVESGIAEEGRSEATLGFWHGASNPARNAVSIRCNLPHAGPMTLEIFDASGRLLRSLLHRDLVHAGLHVIEWDGRDAQGRRVPAGAYTYRLQAVGRQGTGRMVFVR